MGWGFISPLCREERRGDDPAVAHARGGFSGQILSVFVVETAGSGLL